MICKLFFHQAVEIKDGFAIAIPGQKKPEVPSDQGLSVCQLASSSPSLAFAKNGHGCDDEGKEDFLLNV